MLIPGFVFVGWVLCSLVSVSSPDFQRVCCLFYLPAQVVSSWGMLAGIGGCERGGLGKALWDPQEAWTEGGGYSWCSVAALADRVGKVHGQPTCSSGRHGL